MNLSALKNQHMDSSEDQREKEAFYITTTLPYVNAEPHIGFALEIVQADCIARWKRLWGADVFFNTGTDEHGQKVWKAAGKADEGVQAYADRFAAENRRLKDALNLSYTAFIRTTDPHHMEAAQEFWKRCDVAGDIYKAAYEIKYCVGCELEKTDSELVDGCCPLHPNLELEIRQEENYFFRFSKYGDQLLALYDANPDFMIPAFRLNEMREIIAKGLEDFSISRLKEKLPWGVPVPGDTEHVMYVWFDALVNYISTLGWPEDTQTFERFWPGVQVAGKDQVRMQAAMWQAMLLSAGLSPSFQIFIHGFITSEGKKMSKSVGNVVDPFALVEEWGSDVVRYYLLRHLHPTEDSDFSREKFHEAYNSDLVNGLGNLVSRLMTMKIAYDVEIAFPSEKNVWEDPEYEEYHGFLEQYEFNKAADYLWEGVSGLDRFISEKEPFKLVKTDREQAQEIVAYAILKLFDIAVLLEPFMPETSARVRTILKGNEKPEPLFARR